MEEKKEKCCCDNCLHFHERSLTVGFCLYHGCRVGKEFLPCEYFEISDFDEFIKNHPFAVVQSHNPD